MNNFEKYFKNGIIANSLKRERMKSFLWLQQLREYPKFSSIICLNAARLPIADGMLIWDMNPYARAQIKKFIKRQNSPKYLIRTETRGHRLGSPSKLNISPDNVVDEVDGILANYPEAIILLQTLDSLYRNLYNINIKLDRPLDRRYKLEIVGPGFTSPDLNRYGILHETIEIPTFIMRPEESLIRRTYIVANELYQRHRNNKISLLGESYLCSEKSLLLAIHNYVPIGIEYLQTIWKDIEQLKLARDWLDVKTDSAIVSLGFIEQSNQITRSYWDIHGDI